MRDVNILGDVHLGKKFRNGVPLHRIGDREKTVWDDFTNSLMSADQPFHVNLGDQFDKFVVAPEVVLVSAEAYQKAAARAPGTTFVILRGNHDVSRDTSKASSFDLFTGLLAHIPNIVVVAESPVVLGNYGFVPFDAFLTAHEQIKQLPDGLNTVFTHFDYQDWGGPHVLPTELLASKGITRVVNGHDHLRRMERRHGVDVEIFGSMQPYSHAEDPDETLYITLPLAELEGRDVSNMNVRVLLGEGEGIPEGIDCLSIVGKRIGAPDEETIELDTEAFDAVDVERLLSEVLHPLVRDQLMEKYRDAQ